MRRFSGAEVVRGQDRIVFLFKFCPPGRRHLSLPRRMVSRDRSCFCFDRLSGRLESARARGMLCGRFPGLDACRARRHSSRTKPSFFSPPLLPPSVSNSSHLGCTNCCCLPLESSNCRILFCPASGRIEFLTLALDRTREQDAGTRLSLCVEKFGEPEREFCANFLSFSFLAILLRGDSEEMRRGPAICRALASRWSRTNGHIHFLLAQERLHRRQYII